jgi:hypothetical protein
LPLDIGLSLGIPCRNRTHLITGLEAVVHPEDIGYMLVAYGNHSGPTTTTLHPGLGGVKPWGKVFSDSSCGEVCDQCRSSRIKPNHIQHPTILLVGDSEICRSHTYHNQPGRDASPVAVVL